MEKNNEIIWGNINTPNASMIIGGIDGVNKAMLSAVLYNKEGKAVGRLCDLYFKAKWDENGNFMLYNENYECNDGRLKSGYLFA